MKKMLIIGLIFMVLFISACNQNNLPVNNNPEVKGPTCNKPYILSNNECCLDVNDNNICDRGESEAHVSTEMIKYSSDILEITCPKDVRFSTTESRNTEVELKFTAKYLGFGNEQFKPAFYCDDNYSPPINPLNLVLEKGVEQTAKTKVNLQPRECTFSLILASNVNKFVSCKIPIKAV